MTVIAWDGKTLAADKRFTSQGLARTSTKIYRVGRLLCGFCGDADAGMQMVAWVRGGRKPDDFPESQRGNETPCNLTVIEKGRVLLYQGTPHSIVYEDAIYADGSGRDYALAAMACGKTAS